VLAFALALWLACVAGRGVAADGGQAAPRFAYPLVFTQLPAGSTVETSIDPVQRTQRAPYGEGARIVLLSPDRSLRILTGGFHSACDPDLSFDGTRLLFAAKRAANDEWNVYEMLLDGSGLRQITKGRGDCRSPGYQSSHYQISDKNDPWNQITFVRSDSAILNERGNAPARTLYSCKLDGTLIRRLTFNLSSDFDPATTWDGRLLYASWRMLHFEHGLDGRIVLLDANSDGTDYAPFVVQAGKRIKHMPCSTVDGLAVFVESDQVPWDGAGQLACVSLLRPLRTYRSLTGPADGLFHSPSPLPDGGILVSRRTAGAAATHAVCLFDLKTNRVQLLFDDPGYHDLQAKAVAPRPEPDGRSSSVVDSDPNGKLYCMNVYTTDLKEPNGLTPGTVKRLRVLEGLPRTATGAHAASSAGAPVQLATRRSLGEVEIPADGSFNLEVPANTPLELQLLDERGLSLRSCAWVWTRNHFNQGCVGCHEDPELTPDNQFVEALQRPSVLLCPPPEKRAGIDFRRDVMPIVTSKCFPCHDQGGSPPVLRDRTSMDPQRVYQILRAPPEAADSGQPYGKYVHPGRARTSPLVWHVFGQNTSRPWDGPCAAAPVKSIPATPPVQLTDTERQTLVRWIDLGAAYEGIPQATGAVSPSNAVPAGSKR